MCSKDQPVRGSAAKAAVDGPWDVPKAKDLALETTIARGLTAAPARGGVKSKCVLHGGFKASKPAHQPRVPAATYAQPEPLPSKAKASGGKGRCSSAFLQSVRLAAHPFMNSSHDLYMVPCAHATICLMAHPMRLPSHQYCSDSRCSQIVLPALAEEELAVQRS